MQKKKNCLAYSQLVLEILCSFHVICIYTQRMQIYICTYICVYIYTDIYMFLSRV